MNPYKSSFDPNHRPSAGTMDFELKSEGHYAVSAEGVTESGEKCSEGPTKLIPDSRGYPVPDFPGLISVITRPEPRGACGVFRGEGWKGITPRAASSTPGELEMGEQLK